MRRLADSSMIRYGLDKILRSRGVDFATFGTVFDIGSRDGVQAIELAKLFENAEVVAVECNPHTLEECRRNIAVNGRIRLVDKAINEHTGRCAFYPIDTERTVTSWKDGNPGASSLFVANGSYPTEQYVQNKIEVDCVRLDDLCRQLSIDAIDLIWMDLQGAELLALRSAGQLLEKVRYLYTEVSHRAIYQGQCLFPDIESFLTSNGFRRCTQIDTSRWQQDAIYENTRELTDVMIPLGEDDLAGIDLSVRSIRSFVSDVRNIYLIATSDPKIAHARFVDVKTLPCDDGARSRLSASNRKAQELTHQLARLHFQTVHRSSLANVLAVDAGTLFLRRCRFIQDGRAVFNFGDEYDAANFEHMARLHPVLHRMFAYSGIAHVMPFNRLWLEQLHELVVIHTGLPFWRAYLDAIDVKEEGCGASDYEVYFNFCLLHHANDLIIRRFRWRDVEAVEDVQSGTWDYVNVKLPLRAKARVLKLLEQHVDEQLSE